MTLSLREQLLAAGFKPSKETKPEKNGPRAKGGGLGRLVVSPLA